MKKKIGDYVMESLIGSGAYGSVYKGTSITSPGEEYAIKMVSKKNMSDKVFNYLEREVEILQLFNHENVVRLKDIKATDNHYYLIFEYCNGGDLANYRKLKGGHVDNSKVRFLLRQIRQGMDALYLKNAIHRDIKLSNILLTYPDEESKASDTPIVKLGDFGFARLSSQAGEQDTKNIDESQIMSIVGTPLHMAPELLSKQAYSFKADIWSLGTIVYELLCGHNCYTGVNKEDLIVNVNKGFYKIHKELNLTEECLDFLNACLQFNPKERIKWELLKEHPYVVSEKETQFVLEDFKLNNPGVNHEFEDAKDFIFSSNIRYKFFGPKVKGLVKEMEELKIGEIVKKEEEEKNGFVIGSEAKNVEQEYTATKQGIINIDEGYFK